MKNSLKGDVGIESPFVFHAVDRVENYLDVSGVDEEDLGLVVAPWFEEYEDISEGELLPEEDRQWRIDLHARNVSQLRSNGESEYSTDISLEYEDLEFEGLKQEFDYMVSELEDEFPEAEIHYPDREYWG